MTTVRVLHELINSRQGASWPFSPLCLSISWYLSYAWNAHTPLTQHQLLTRQVQLLVSLVRDALGRPKYFLCLLLPHVVKDTSLLTSSSSLGESSVAAGASRGSSGGTDARSSVPCKRASSAVKVAVKVEGAPNEESQRSVRICSRKLDAKPAGKGKTPVWQEDVEMACFSRGL